MAPATFLRSALCYRFALLATACVASLAAAGCGSSADVDTYFVDYLPFTTGDVDTDLIFPREQGASRFLVSNWPPQRTLEGETMWVHGRWAQIRFFNVADATPTFVAEAAPYVHPRAPQQTMTVDLNGTTVAVLPMPPRWETHEFELPAEAVKIGWNLLELRFENIPRPSDYDPASNDGRTLAAQFRRLEIRPALGRPYWPQRHEAVRSISTGFPTTASDASAESAPSAIEMPTDSLFEIFLAAGSDTELAGAFDAVFLDSTGGGEIHVAADVVEPDMSTRIWETVLTAGSAAGELRASLAPWADRVVQLRMRVFGNTNGTVRWRGLGTTTTLEAAGALPTSPGELVEPPRSSLLERPDIFVILLDAARADAFDGSRGADLAPNVQRLGREGTSFTQTWAPSPWTGQSVPALLSGMNPDALGIETWESRLPTAATILPETMLEHGYHTTLWSQHNIYRDNEPLRFGFEDFSEVPTLPIEHRELLPAVSDLVVEDRPTFALIHLLPPHAPYTPPEPFGGSRSGWYNGDFEVTVDLLHGFDLTVPEDQHDDVRRYAVALYEENVRFADHLVGRLLEDLREAGRYDNALIVVISDHGEAFYEHGTFLHLEHVYEEYLHVPFVVKWPAGLFGFAPVVDEPVSLVDLVPTLVDLLGIDADTGGYQGRTLVPLVLGSASPDRIVYAHTSGRADPQWPARPEYAVRWRELKLVYDARSETTRLFRLSDDPAEQNDLAEEMPFETGLLKQLLLLAQAQDAELLLNAGGARLEALSEEAIRRLRALGYLR